MSAAEPRHSFAANLFFGADHPLFNSFGIQVEESTENGAAMSMEWVADLCNQHGVLHQGAIATLLDTNCGLAIFTHLGDMRPIATIDLRIDHTAVPGPGEGVRSEVECFAVTGDVAYVRGVAKGVSSDKLLASVAASFAIGAHGPSFDRATEVGAMVSNDG